MNYPTILKHLFLLTLLLGFISCSSDSNESMDADATEDHSDDEMGDPHDHGNDDMEASDDTPTSPVEDTGGTLYVKDESTQVVVEGFDLEIDRIELGSQSIHNQIPIDTQEGIKFDNLFNENYLLIKDVFMHQLATDNFYPIADAHLQQDLSACMAWENGNALVRPNTIYIRSHEENQVDFVDFNPNTDKINFIYLSVRGDDELNFSTEQTSEGVRFFSPITGQSITLRGTTYGDFKNEHFEWRANQLEDNIASRMGLAQKLNGFQVINENVYSGKSIANAGGVDRAPYHVYNHDNYTGTPRKEEPDFEN
ncbi:MAG: hypothetical protein AAF717_04965 [Bacteroidota bacterium]